MPAPRNARPLTTRQRAVAAGYRSGLEEKVAASLRARGAAFTYEQHVIRYDVPSRQARYTPDTVLANGIVVETKGRWVAEDRKKLKLVREQHPLLDLRIVFSRSSTRISKTSATTYAKIAATLGIPYADGDIPQAWLDEPVNEASLALIERFRKP